MFASLERPKVIETISAEMLNQVPKDAHYSRLYSA